MPASAPALVLASVLGSVLGNMGDGKWKKQVLLGPKTPYWGCMCGCNVNWASRIGCRDCGGPAPTRVVQAAHRADAATKSQPKVHYNSKARGAWASGPPQHELEKLRAEVAKLRAGAPIEAKMDQDENEEEPVIEIQKAQAAYDATVAAYGANSKRALEQQADLAELRATRDQARTVPTQIRVLGRKITDKQKQIEAAKLVATVAAESVRAAQRVLEAADAKVVDIATKLAEVERVARIM